MKGKEHCDHNWEIGQVRPEWTPTTDAPTSGYKEIAIVICPFCGIVRKTVIETL